MLLTLELLESLFVIDRDKGVLYWRESHSHTCEAGSVAGTPKDDGRYTLVIHGKRYLRSRIMWFIYHGYVPEKQIDHKNCRPWEDYKGNLREVTDQENKLNKRKQSNNTSGITGVVWDKSRNKWRAQLKYQRKMKNLGRFDTIQEAAEARQKEMDRLGFDKSHGTDRDNTDKPV